MPLIIPSNSQSASGYTIGQSIRFNEVDSPYMQKTYSGNGSRTTWSFSFWTKLGKSPPYNTTRGEWFQAYNTTSGAQEDIRIIGTNQQLQWFTHNDGGSGTLADLKTTQYLRDHSAWYHILCVADRTNAVAEERQRMYINGQRVTDFATETYPSKDAEGHIGKSADVHYIGSRAGNSNTRIDGYMAEIHYLDGLAYDPSFFGEFNDSGIWIPKEYTGSYGTNGFKIDGRDSSDLGDDESGQGNDYTTSGLASHDQVSDSPTNNFAVANPLHATAYMGSYAFSEGNLQFTFGSSVGGLATIAVTSGKWYVEWEVHGSASPAFYLFGIYGDEPSATTRYVGYEANSYGYYAYNGTYWNNNVGTSYGDSFGAGDIIGMALDLDNNKLYFSKNGTFQNSGDPTSGSTGTGAISISSASSVPLEQYFIAGSSGSSSPSNHSANYNFGQDGTFAGNVTAGGNSDANGVGNFKYSVPSGYLALCTKNLGS